MKSSFLPTERQARDSRRLFGILLVALLVIGSTGPANAKLVGYWKFDGSASDCSGRGNDGIEKGTPTYDLGAYGLALKLGGGGDCVSVPNASQFNFSRALTVAAWVMIGRFAQSNQPIVTKGTNCWRLGTEWASDRVSLYCNGPKPNERVVASRKFDYDKWYHVAGVYDGSKMYLYIDGLLDVSANSSGKISQSKRQVTIGGFSEGPCWTGLIDEVLILNHALSANEVAQLYAQGDESFLEPTLAEFTRVTRQAEHLLREQKSQQAVVLLEKQIAESDKCKRENPDKAGILEHVSAELRLQLARAKDAAGFPSQEVLAAYNRATASARLYSLSSWTSALLSVCQGFESEDYARTIQPLMQNTTWFLRAVTAKSRALVDQQQWSTAIRFLEATLGAYTNWQQQHPYYDIAGEYCLPELYFQLAQAKETAGLPKEGIADAYAKTFIGSDRSDRRCVAERTTALMWLLENERAQEYTEVIKSLVHSSDVNDPQADIVRKVCVDLESAKNWALYERFLDTLFATARHPGNWAVLVGSCLSDKENQWAKKYFKHVSSSPGLVFRGESILAEEYMAEKNFKKAAAIYRDILKRCGPDDDRARFELQLCKCLLDARQYREAKSKLESFISNNRATDRYLAKQAMLMKGRTHVQLGELDEALASYFTLMVEYPDLENVPEIDFFIGYCYMLQGKLKAAAETFDCLITGYPESAYTEKARVCLARLKESTAP